MYSLAAFSSDSRFIKWIVYGVYVLETIQSVLILSDALQIFVFGFTNEDSLLQINTLWISLPILTGLVTFSCQGLFAYRIWILGKNGLFKAAFWTIALYEVAQLTASLVLAVILKNLQNFERIIDTGQTPMFSLVTSIWIFSSVIVDVLVALCMINLRSYVDTGGQRARNILRKVVRLTAGTGSMTAAIALITVVVMLAQPKNGYYKPSLATLGKMYSNCMMVMLNSRMTLEAGSTELSGQREKNRKQGLTNIELAG